MHQMVLSKNLFIIELHVVQILFYKSQYKNVKKKLFFSIYLRHAFVILKFDIPCSRYLRAAPVNYDPAKAPNLNHTCSEVKQIQKQVT